MDEQKKPFQVIRIYHTIILDDPFPDPPGMPPIPASPELENRKQSKNTFEVRLGKFYIEALMGNISRHSSGRR